MIKFCRILLPLCSQTYQELTQNFHFQDVAYKVMNNPTDNSDRPIKPVKIADVKVIQVDQPFVVAKEGVTV